MIGRSLGDAIAVRGGDGCLSEVSRAHVCQPRLGGMDRGIIVSREGFDLFVVGTRLIISASG